MKTVYFALKRVPISLPSIIFKIKLGLFPFINAISIPAFNAILAACSFVTIPPVPLLVPAPPAHFSMSSFISSIMEINFELLFSFGSES